MRWIQDQRTRVPGAATVRRCSRRAADRPRRRCRAPASPGRPGTAVAKVGGPPGERGRLLRRGRDGSPVPECRLIRVAVEAVHRRAAMGSARVPTDEVEPAAAHWSMSSPPVRTSPTPLSPGPPGLARMVPIRWSGLLARCRITARVSWSPSGSDQSTGTGTSAQSRSGSGSQGCQAIPDPASPDGLGLAEVVAELDPEQAVAARATAVRIATATRRGRWVIVTGSSVSRW
jgi:hypothetical protein